MEGDEKMCFEQVPRWLFIMYQTHFEHGDFKPTIKMSIPFATRSEAEQYAEKFTRNIYYEHSEYETTCFAIIPANYRATQVSIIYTGYPSIRIGSKKTLRVDTIKPITWSVDSECKVSFISEGNSITITCPDDNAYLNKAVTVKAEVEGVTDECVLTFTS